MHVLSDYCKRNCRCNQQLLYYSYTITYTVYVSHAGVEVAGYHVGSLRNAGDAVALRESGGDGGKEKCRRKKNLVLSHNSIMFELWRGDG